MKPSKLQAGMTVGGSVGWRPMLMLRCDVERKGWHVRYLDSREDGFITERLAENAVHSVPVCSYADLGRERTGLFVTKGGTVLDGDRGDINPYPCDYPLDREIWEAAQAEPVDATCSIPDTTEKYIDIPGVSIESNAPLCDDGRDARAGNECQCPGQDCPDCLAYFEIDEAWADHALWLAVHAPAGDVDRRAAEDHAEQQHKIERDRFLWGIAR